jgi:hypothetical protein
VYHSVLADHSSYTFVSLSDTYFLLSSEHLKIANRSFEDVAEFRYLETVLLLIVLYR